MTWSVATPTWVAPPSSMTTTDVNTPRVAAERDPRSRTADGKP